MANTTMMYIINLILKFLNIYSKKILLLSSAIVCCLNVDALHGTIFVLLIIGIMSDNSKLQTTVINITNTYFSLLILAKMMFQTKLFPHSKPNNVSCTIENGDSLNQIGFTFSPNADWFGFLPDTTKQFQGYFIVLTLATLLRGVRINRIMKQEIEEQDCLQREVLFPNIVRENADENIKGAVMFLFDYGFQKFGLEFCKIILAALAAERRDVFGVIYGIILIILLTLPRRTVRRIWGVTFLFVSFCIAYQYAVAIGAYPSLCFDYPGPISSELRNWLFLPYHDSKLSSYLIIGDVILLYRMREQRSVFEIEIKNEFHPAGSNEPVYQHFEDENIIIPVPDHTIYARPGIDYFKLWMFNLLYWTSLTVTFLAGSIRSNMISLGYLVGAFLVIWQGTDLYLWKTSRVAKWWNFFIVYAASSIVFKVLMTDFNCMRKGNEPLTGLRWGVSVTSGTNCENHNTLFWDFLAFICFLFQKRFFQSYYFLHHVNDVKSTMLLQNIGAALIKKQKHDKVENEKKERLISLRKVKAEMAAMKENEVRNTKRSHLYEPVTHDHAIMLGDYFIFEDDEKKFREEDSSRKNSLFTDEKFSTKSIESIVGRSTDDLSLQNSKTCSTKIRNMFTFVSIVADDIINDVIFNINNMTHDFRFVAWVMEVGKIKLKRDRSNHNENLILPTFQDFERVEAEDEKKNNIFYRLFEAVWFLLEANSELVCYLAIVCHQIVIPSILSLPLPLMVLLWGALTLGRPSPTFWTTLIAYTEVVIVVKAIFSNEIFVWNWHRGNHRSLNVAIAHLIIGVGFKASVLYDILLLLILFTHRQKLKSFGLWTDYVEENDNAEEKVYFINGLNQKLTTGFCQHLKPIKDFWARFKKDTLTLPKDVYTLNFLLEFITFIIIFFGFPVFSQTTAHDNLDKFYLADNEVPVAYLITIIIQFFVILLDRALYLKKHMIGKVISHIVLVISTHVWLFMVLPVISHKSFVQLTIPKIWYVFKYCSFLLSAYQIRAGFPMRVQGHFLRQKYNRLTYYAALLFKLIPFFAPVRELTTWLSVKTSLTINEWLLLESMAYVVFIAKCNRSIVEKYPVPRGRPCSAESKWVNGIFYLGGIILVIWSPLILFAFFNSMAISSPPKGAMFNIHINHYQTLYTYEIDEDEIARFDNSDYHKLQGLTRHNSRALFFLEQYDNMDVFIFKLNPSSRPSWNISPGNLQQMIQDISSEKDMILHFSWVLIGEEGQKFSGEYNTTLEEKTVDDMLNALTNKEKKSMHFNFQTPLYFEMKDGKTTPIIFEYNTNNPFGYGNLTLSLHGKDENMWWDISDNCFTEETSLRRMEQPQRECGRAVLYVFSPKQVPGIYRFFTAKGIIGIYASFVLLIWTFMRRSMASLHLEVKFNSLPNVNYILRLLNNIQLARESEEFALEEDLYSKLLFLFRSSETMIKVTRLREEELRLTQQIN